MAPRHSQFDVERNFLLLRFLMVELCVKVFWSRAVALETLLGYCSGGVGCLGVGGGRVRREGGELRRRGGRSATLRAGK